MVCPSCAIWGKQDSGCNRQVGRSFNQILTEPRKSSSRCHGVPQQTYGTLHAWYVLLLIFEEDTDPRQIWDLFEGDRLFRGIFEANGSYDPFRHLAKMVALLGPPPPAFVVRSDTTAQCFDAEGNLEFRSYCNWANLFLGQWCAQEHVEITSTTFSVIERRLETYEQDKFLTFIKSMLRWLPEERKSARQLLEDPWLRE